MANEDSILEYSLLRAFTIYNKTNTPYLERILLIPCPPVVDAYFQMHIWIAVVPGIPVWSQERCCSHQWRKCCHIPLLASTRLPLICPCRFP